MTKRQMAYLACTAAVTASVLGAAPSTEHPTVHWVEPGGSIQKAVNSAHPGYRRPLPRHLPRECPRHGVVTLRGYGARSTVIVPGKASGSCAKAGDGICVTGTDKKRVNGVTISSLTLRGFAKHGLWVSASTGSRSRKWSPRRTASGASPRERSVRGVFRYNLARNNGDAGLFRPTRSAPRRGPPGTPGRSSVTTF